MRRTKSMGETIARLRFRESREGEPVTLDLLVDTGSTYSWIDGRVLKALGVRRARTRRFLTIEGRRIRRDLGDAYVEYPGGVRADRGRLCDAAGRPGLGPPRLGEPWP